jgi:hypothetical protein
MKHVFFKAASPYGEDPFRPVSLKDTVYCSMVANGVEDKWNFLWKKMLAGKQNSAEKINILAGFACSKNPYFLEVSTSYVSLEEWGWGGGRGVGEGGLKATPTKKISLTLTPHT